MIINIPTKVMQVRACQRELTHYNRINGFKFNYQYIGNDVVCNSVSEHNFPHVQKIANIVRSFGIIE